MIYLFGYETYQPVNMVMGNIFREHFARFRGLDPNCSPFFNLDLATYHNQSETNYDEWLFTLSKLSNGTISYTKHIYFKFTDGIILPHKRTYIDGIVALQMVLYCHHKMT